MLSLLSLSGGSPLYISSLDSVFFSLSLEKVDLFPSSAQSHEAQEDESGPACCRYAKRDLNRMQGADRTSSFVCLARFASL